MRTSFVYIRVVVRIWVLSTHVAVSGYCKQCGRPTSRRGGRGSGSGLFPPGRGPQPLPAATQRPFAKVLAQTRDSIPKIRRRNKLFARKTSLPVNRLFLKEILTKKIFTFQFNFWRPINYAFDCLEWATGGWCTASMPNGLPLFGGMSR